MNLILNYGTLPERSVFDLAFEREISSGGYEIAHGSSSYSDPDRPDAGVYSADELWDELERLVVIGDERSLAWASDILGTLSIEWI